jgi:hypothetical protein
LPIPVSTEDDLGSPSVITAAEDILDSSHIAVTKYDLGSPRNIIAAEDILD